MQDFVSKPWMKVTALAVAMSAVSAIFVPFGFPWTGLFWVGLAFFAAYRIAGGSPRSIASVLHDVDREPAFVLAPNPAAVKPSKAVF